MLFEAELDHALPRPNAGHLLLILQSTAVGGMETHCVDLAAEYVHRGNSVSVIIPEAPSFDDLAARFRKAGSRFDRLNTDGRAGRLAQFANSLRLIKILVRLSQAESTCTRVAPRVGWQWSPRRAVSPTRPWSSRSTTCPSRIQVGTIASPSEQWIC